MLYTNKALEAVSKEMKFGTITGVAIGEYGCGCNEVFLPAPESVDVINGFRHDLTISTSKSGKPRIDARKDGDIYLLLSSRSEYERRKNDYVTAPRSQEIELIARGIGAVRNDGRFWHWWDAVIVKAKDGDVFRLDWNGSRRGYGYDATFYVVFGGKVYSADQPDIEDLYESLGLEIPFLIQYNKNKGCLVVACDEWKIV